MHSYYAKKIYILILFRARAYLFAACRRCHTTAKRNYRRLMQAAVAISRPRASLPRHTSDRRDEAVTGLRCFNTCSRLRRTYSNTGPMMISPSDDASARRSLYLSPNINVILKIPPIYSRYYIIITSVDMMPCAPAKAEFNTRKVPSRHVNIS